MKGNIQEKLRRVRPPRVQITYDLDIGDAIETKELPFIVGILADLSGNPKEPLPPVKERDFVLIDRDNFDDVMDEITPRLTLIVPDELTAPVASESANGESEQSESAQMSVELLFNCLDDFSPTPIVKQVDQLNELFSERSNLRDLLSKLDGNDLLNKMLGEVITQAEKQTAMKGSFDGKTEEQIATDDVDENTNNIIENGGMVLDDSQKATARRLLASFVKGVIGEGVTVEEADKDKVDAVARITDRVAVIDDILTRQLNHILHHESFQRLEGSWRGLSYLVMQSETGKFLKLKLLNASKDDLLKDLTKAVEFDQSALFKIVYEKVYGTFGGDPYSVLIGDYEVGRHPRDMEFINKISQVASAAHAPFITNAYAKLFDLADFSSLHKPRDLNKIFQSQELTKWRRFRESEDSRYVTMTMPRVLIRLPYGPDTKPVEDLNFTESVDGSNTKGFLWTGSAFILAERITQAYSLYKWTAAIRGVEGGGLVEGLPAYTFKTDKGDIALTCPTEVQITDRREKELNDLGFMAICHCKGTDKAAFFGGQITNQPGIYNTDEATANARASSMLPYIITTSRFAHYIKAMMRDKVGSFMTRGNVEDYLNTWIAQYVLLDDSPPQEVKARYPLRQARIAVSDVPGKPGAYRATVLLRPHFQLEELTTSIRIVAELPA